MKYKIKDLYVGAPLTRKQEVYNIDKWFIADITQRSIYVNTYESVLLDPTSKAIGIDIVSFNEEFEMDITKNIDQFNKDLKELLK